MSIHANVYAPFRDTVQHITPYTTWVVRLDARSRDVDISRVTAITLRLDGSAIPNAADLLKHGPRPPMQEMQVSFNEF